MKGILLAFCAAEFALNVMLGMICIIHRSKFEFILYSTIILIDVFHALHI